MLDDPTPEDLEAQMRESEAEMEELASMLENEADLLGMLAKEQGRELAAQAQEHLPLLAGGAAAVGLLLALLLRGGSSDEEYETGVPVRELDDDYVSLLSRVIRHRLRQDDEMPLGEALAKTLREQAPVLFRRPPEPTTSSSSWGRRLLGLGALAVAGVGANFLAKELTGQSLIDLVKGKSTYDVDEKYQAPHRTAGSRMPAPTKPPAAPETPPPPPAETPSDTPGAPKPAAAPEPPAVPEAPATPTDRTEPRSEPEGDFDEVHGTSGSEMPDPDATDSKKAPKEGMPAAAEGAAGETDAAKDLAEPQGELPGKPPKSKKNGKKK